MTSLGAVGIADLMTIKPDMYIVNSQVGHRPFQGLTALALQLPPP
jgi:hypothetical protein